jgi:hypothetical protein
MRPAAATPWGVDAKVVQDHHGDPPTRAGACNGPAELVAEWHGAAAVGQLEVQGAVAPVHQPKAVLLGVGARGLHPPLPGATSARPDPGQGRVQGDLDLVLQVQIRAAQQPEQAGQVLGEQVVGQGRIGDQTSCGWRHR